MVRSTISVNSAVHRSVPTGSLEASSTILPSGMAWTIRIAVEPVFVEHHDGLFEDAPLGRMDALGSRTPLATGHGRHRNGWLARRAECLDIVDRVIARLASRSPAAVPGVPGSPSAVGGPSDATVAVPPSSSVERDGVADLDGTWHRHTGINPKVIWERRIQFGHGVEEVLGPTQSW
jgi:hypothetical protein